MATSAPASAAPFTADQQTIDRLAELIVNYGANVQPDQIVAIAAELGKEQLVRALTAAAYKRGARFVEVGYIDPHIKLARLKHANPETLELYPSWFGHRMLELGEQRCARIALSGPVAPHILEGIDPALIGREQSVARKEGMKLLNDQTTNWVIAPCPTRDWAELVYPDLSPEDAYTKLWEEISWVCRLDQDDPAAAWAERMRQLESAASKLSERNFDAIRFSGPGTDLTVGMLPSHRFISGGGSSTVDGINHVPNIPTEEIFTSPDPERVNGRVRSTKPLFTHGVIIEGLEIEFENGHAVKVEAETNADTLRQLIARDEHASRLGELALVDGAGRIGPLGTVFFDTLLDENAASHIAFGRGFDFAIGKEDQSRVNNSEIHIDFMIGGPEVAVSGITASGEEVPVLVDGEWKI